VVPLLLMVAAASTAHAAGTAGTPATAAPTSGPAGVPSASAQEATPATTAAAAATLPAPAPPAATTEALARQLVQVTGGGALGKQVLAEVVRSYRASNPNVPEAFWSELEASVDAHQLQEIAVPIYVRNLTADEMAAAVQFYSSPAGQSIIRKMPGILQQSIAAGQEYGRELGRQVTDRLAKYKQTHPDA
jgi:hypothetical protein